MSRKRLSVVPQSIIPIQQQENFDRREKGTSVQKSSRQDYSYFPKEIAQLCTQLYLKDCTHIFDPFAGWGERHHYCKKEGLSYTGFDINPGAIAKARETFGVDNVLANSLEADIPVFDGFLTCPPYWNLEKYSEGGIDHSQTWEEFIEMYTHILHRAWKATDKGVFCIYVGDWRSDNVFYDLTYQTMKIFDGLGATLFDTVIGHRVRSKVSIMVPQALSFGYTVKVHEQLLIYRKGEYNKTVTWEDINEHHDVSDLFE